MERSDESSNASSLWKPFSYKRMVEKAAVNSFYHVELLKAKVKAGCKPDEHLDDANMTPPFWVISSLGKYLNDQNKVDSHFKIMSFLLKHGCNVNHRNRANVTLLSFMLWEVYAGGGTGEIAVRFAKLYYKHGASLRDTGYDRETVYCMAAQINDPECLLLKWLLSVDDDVKASVNVKGYDGLTPLMYAVDALHPEAIRLLGEAGADPFLKNNQSENLSTFLIGRRGTQDVVNAVTTVSMKWVKRHFDELKKMFVIDITSLMLEYLFPK
jgi:hypothetical protein